MKVITALALTVVMLVAMTGIAAGGGYVTGVVTDGTNSVAGATVTVYDDLIHSNPALATTTSGSGGTYMTIWIDSLQEDQQVWVTATKGDMSGETAGYANKFVTGGFEANIAVILVSFDIPEFATIAMPVAAILGLLFFFNHRKHKKE